MTDIAPGLADPAHDSQRLFRAVLQAFSHPGRIVGLPNVPQPVGGLSAATTAFLLTLVDRDTPLWLAPSLALPQVRDFVRFHTGAPVVGHKEDALFAVTTPGQGPLLDDFSIGTDPYPDRSATVVIEVVALTGGPDKIWRGPGIDGQTRAAVAGLPAGFWDEWAANHALFPCGVDVVFASGTELIALPRSIAVEDAPCT